jgi:regulatory protein
VRLLAARDRSEQEIRERLAASGAGADVIDHTIARLRDLRYLDERRFALGVAERAWESGHGSEYVRAHLTTRGVPEALIDEALTGAFGDEQQLARRVLARRHPGALRHPADRAKAARYLAQRGFPEAVVLAILGEGC